MKRQKDTVVKEKKNISALPIAFFVALVVGVLAYLAMLKIETNVLSGYERTKVYVSAQTIGEDMVLTQDNIPTYIVEKTIDTDNLPAGAVTDVTTLIGKALKYDVTDNSVLTDTMFYDVNKIYAQFTDPKEIGLNMSELSQAVSGIVRTGDYVDIYIFSDSNQSVVEALRASNETQSGESQTTGRAGKDKTEGTSVITPMYKNVYVSKAFDSAGAQIANEDTTTTCQRINIVVNAEDASRIYEAVRKGTIYISRTVKNSDN